MMSTQSTDAQPGIESSGARSKTPLGHGKIINQRPDPIGVTPLARACPQPPRAWPAAIARRRLPRPAPQVTSRCAGAGPTAPDQRVRRCSPNFAAASSPRIISSRPPSGSAGMGSAGAAGASAVSPARVNRLRSVPSPAAMSSESVMVHWPESSTPLNAARGSWGAKVPAVTPPTTSAAARSAPPSSKVADRLLPD